MSKICDLAPVEPIVRYKHEAPGDLLHIDTKKLGRIVRPSHRVTVNRRDAVDGAGGTPFVAIDDHAKRAFIAMRSEEKQAQAVLFLNNAVALLRALGHYSEAPADGQRCRVLFPRLPRGLRRVGDQAKLYATLPIADQRQSRAVHSVCATRMGIRLDLPALPSTNGMP